MERSRFKIPAMRIIIEKIFQNFSLHLKSVMKFS